MTTIACNLELMASDSRVTLDGFDVTYPAIKIFRAKDMIVGGAGDGENVNLMIEWAKTGFKPSSRPKYRKKRDKDDDSDALLLILKRDGIYILADMDSEPEKIEADFYAVGSGGDAARVAMKLGQTPENAVELACEVDNKSGPPVQVLRLKDVDKG